MGGPSSLQSVNPIPGTTYFGIHGSFDDVINALLLRVEKYIYLHHFNAECSYVLHESDSTFLYIQAYDPAGDPFFLAYLFN